MIINKYPRQSKKRNEEFFNRKDQELTNLDWAKWAGWFDTDGCFSKHNHKTTKRWQLLTTLKLRDKQPVDLFSKTFETSLVYSEFPTETPNGNKYIAKVYQSGCTSAKATWFTENIFPYLIKEEKREFAAKLLGYRPKSKDFTTWTPAEVTQYLATVIEGDGYVRCFHNKYTISVAAEISSSDDQYLYNMIHLGANKLGLHAKVFKKGNYKTKKGKRTKFVLYISCSQTFPDNSTFFKSLVKDGVMTLDRKKEVVQEFVTWMNSNKVNLKTEIRV
jgi:hypothetical protein